MIKIKTIIVEDKNFNRQMLAKKLACFAELDIVAVCQNGCEAIKAAADLSADLLFFDIPLPHSKGIKVINDLQAKELPLMVFTSVSEHFACAAFEINAVDYLTTPFTDQRLKCTVQRAVERFNYRTVAANQASNLIVTNAHASSPVKQASESHIHWRGTDYDHGERKIVIKDRDDITLLKQSDIEWIDAAGDYVCLHAAGITHIKRSTLKSLLADLDSSIFKRVHRSTIVNLNCIQKVIPHTKGEFFLKFGEYDQVKVSRNYREVIKSFLSQQ